MKKWSIKKLSLLMVQMLALYLISLMGVFISSFLNLPIPGSIVGLLLLLVCLHFKVIKEKQIKDGAGFLLVLLPIFLIPATVGVIQFPMLLSMKGMLIIGIVIMSTLITMIVAGRVSERYENKHIEGA